MDYRRADRPRMTHPPFVEFGCSTFTTLQLSSGVHFIQVSKWLGHSTFTLTLDVYGDWIQEDDVRCG